MPDTRHSLATLSFTSGSRDTGRISLWKPPSSDDPAECNAEGRRRADELVAYMDAHRTPFLLGHVVGAIIARGAYGPLEVGFFQVIAMRALAADIPLQEARPKAKPHLELVK